MGHACVLRPRRPVWHLCGPSAFALGLGVSRLLVARIGRL